MCVFIGAAVVIGAVVVTVDAAVVVGAMEVALVLVVAFCFM